MPSRTSHILLGAPPAWGHLRSLIGLACKLVQKRPGAIVITIPVVGDYKYLAEKEVDQHLQSEQDKPLKNDIHVISLGGEGKDPMNLVSTMFQTFESFYISLHSVSPIKCASGRTHIYTQAPDVVIADFFFLACVNTIRKITQRKIPIFCWNSAGLSPVMRLVGPEALGGMGDIEAKAKALAAKTGKPYEEAELEVFHPQTGEVVAPPGMPPMYDYEYYANEIDPQMLSVQIPFHKQAFTMVTECDGMVSATSLAFEPEGSKATKAWYAESNKRMYVVGPILPDDVLKDVPSDLQDVPAEDRDVVAFLNKIHASSGAHSLLYISFGSMFWPKGEGIWNAVEYVFDSGIPLLLAYDEPRLGKIPERIAKKFNESDKALTSIWAPQQTILQHHATGWLMTHCGHNSIMEAVIQGVPMIAWPMEAEQPGNAAYLSIKLNIAYQIIEGRSGLGLRPLYRGVTPKGTLEALSDEIKGILKNAFGEDGKEKRENVRVLKEKMRAGLREGGDSLVELERFIGDYLSA